MTQPLGDRYRQILDRARREDAGECLAEAQALGREALTDGMSLLDLAEAHHAAVTGILDGITDGATRSTLLERAEDLLLEALSPFEMSLRGYQEANQALQALTAELEARVEARSRELAEAEARYRELVEHVPAITYTADLSQPESLVWVSPQIGPLLGNPPADWIDGSHLWLERIHPDDRDRVLAERARARQGDGRLRTEYRLLDRQGQERWFRDEGRFSDEPGKESCLRGILLDITEQRALEAQLRHAQRMEAVGQLAGGIAHDFNNLLCVVLARAELAEEELPSEHPVQESLGSIVRAANGGAALVRQLLAFSRKQASRPRVVELGELVRGLRPILEGALREHHVLVLDLAEDAGAVRVDPNQLEQVLLNLVVNARDAMPGGGTLQLSVQSGHAPVAAPIGGPEGVYGDTVELRVTDTGHGMSDEIQRRIFEPYFTTKGPSRGTGLGLATCYGIIRQNGGVILVESAPGQGAAFRVVLPRVWETPRQVATTDPVAPLPRGEGEHLLVVEDNPDVRELIVSVLSRQGYTLTVAEDGREALRLVETGRDGNRLSFALLLSDVVMPGMGGPELAAKLRAWDPELPVVLITGYTVRDLEELELGGPAPLRLDKPFSTRQLVEVVQRGLKGRG